MNEETVANHIITYLFANHIICTALHFPTIISMVFNYPIPSEAASVEQARRAERQTVIRAVVRR